MPPAPSREIRLVARPVGLPRPDDFELALHEAPAPAAGEVQVRNLWMSVDPYMRGRLAGAETLGAPPAGSALGRVTASADPRFVICGMISQYNDETPPPGPRNLFALVTKRIRMEGFMLGDHLHEEEAFRQEMTAWLKAATVQSRETVVHGLENAVGAFLGLFSGENTGKMLVKL